MSDSLILLRSVHVWGHHVMVIQFNRGGYINTWNYVFAMDSVETVCSKPWKPMSEVKLGEWWIFAWSRDSKSHQLLLFSRQEHRELSYQKQTRP